MCIRDSIIADPVYFLHNSLRELEELGAMVILIPHFLPVEFLTQDPGWYR